MSDQKDDEVRFLGGDYRFGQPALRVEWREIEDCAVPWRWRDEAVEGCGEPCTEENSYTHSCAKCGAEMWFPKVTNSKPPSVDRLCFSCEERGGAKP